MTNQTKIEWTDFTVNFWEGCQKVGPGCDNCYAETRDKRFTGGKHWGPDAPRRKVKGGIAKLRKINRDAAAFKEANGHWPRVFCSSLSDVFDNAVDPEWRREAFTAITVAPRVRIQLLTKRIGNVEKMIPEIWKSNGWPHWVGLMITVVNQEEADRDIPKLLDLKARLGIPWVGLSMEPLLGAVDLSEAWHGEDALNADCWGDCGWCDKGRPALHNCKNGRQTSEEFLKGKSGLDWVIVGGESGHHARPIHPDWVRSLRDQCTEAGVPFLFKQWGEWIPGEFGPAPDVNFQNGDWMDVNTVPDIDLAMAWCEDWANDDFEGHCLFHRTGKKAAGRLLDGREWNEVPNGQP